MLFQETPLAVQVQRGRLGVILDDPQHVGRLTCFMPQEVTLYRPQTAYWVHCPTEVVLPGHPQHSGVPAWLSPDTWDYAELVKRVGREEAMTRRAIFWRGFPDVRRNRWCGQCFWQQCLIDCGEQLGYPAMEGVEAGYEAWLQLARYGGSLRVQEGAHRAKQLLHSMIARRRRKPTGTHHHQGGSGRKAQEREGLHQVANPGASTGGMHASG